MTFFVSFLLTTLKPPPPKLPENWGEKLMADGRVYYYNMVTNETTWKRPDNNKSSNRKGSGQDKKSAEEELALQLIFPIPDKAGASKAVWAAASQGLLGSISDLNEAVKINKKDVFVNATKVIIKAIQTLFKATGTYETNSPHLTKSKALATHHKEITDILSKLVLASKLASGVWPPPDATSRVQQIMLDVVKVLKSFMTTAIDQAVSIEASVTMPARAYQPPPKIAKKVLPKPTLAKPAPPQEIVATAAVAATVSEPASQPAQAAAAAAANPEPVSQQQPDPEPEPEQEPEQEPDSAVEPEVHLSSF